MYLTNQPVKVGDKIETFFSGRADHLSTVLAIEPYTGIYKEHFNCILKLSSSNVKGWTRMAYQMRETP